MDLAGSLHPLPDDRGSFSGTAIGELLMGDAGDLEVDIDAVQQRAADPLLDHVVNWRPTKRTGRIIFPVPGEMAEAMEISLITAS